MRYDIYIYTHTHTYIYIYMSLGAKGLKRIPEIENLFGYGKANSAKNVNF